MKEGIDEIIKSENLKDITIDLVEMALDNQITNEVLKEVPILKSLVAVRNIYNSYTDRIFIKKTMNVLLELGEINWKDRVELTSDLDDDDGTGTEKILMAIDGIQTIQKCKVFGRLCKLKALNKIDKDDFLRLTKLIQDAYLEDISLVPYFVEKKKEDTYADEFFPLIALGLIYQEQSEPAPIEKVEPYKLGDSPYYTGGEINFTHSLSILGTTLMKYYGDLFPDDLK